MPIYEYRCDACGFQKDYLMKMSDAPLTTCPECSKQTFSKMLTAAGFQLKGSGWYATDFKGGAKPKEEKSQEAKPKEDKKEAAAPACSTGAGPVSTTS